MSSIIAKYAEKDGNQIRTGWFSSDESYLSTLFLDNSKTACDRSSIQDGAAAQLFPHFIPEPGKATLSQLVTADKMKGQHESNVTNHFQVFSYILQAYAPDGVIAEAEADVTNLGQPAGMTAVRYSETFLKKALRFGITYNDSRSKNFLLSSYVLLPAIQCVPTVVNTREHDYIALRVL